MQFGACYFLLWVQESIWKSHYFLLFKALWFCTVHDRNRILWCIMVQNIRNIISSSFPLILSTSQRTKFMKRPYHQQVFTIKISVVHWPVYHCLKTECLKTESLLVIMGSKLCCCGQSSTSSDTEETDIPLQEIDEYEPYNFNRNVQRSQQHIRGDLVDYHRSSKWFLNIWTL